jgi:hypothetical protein
VNTNLISATCFESDFDQGAIGPSVSDFVVGDGEFAGVLCVTWFCLIEWLWFPVFFLFVSWFTFFEFGFGD